MSDGSSWAASGGGSSGDVPSGAASGGGSSGDVPSGVAPDGSSSGDVPSGVAPGGGSSGDVPSGVAPEGSSSGDVPSGVAPGGGSSGDVPSGAAPGASGSKCTQHAPILKKLQGGKPMTSPVTPADALIKCCSSLQSAWVSAYAQLDRTKKALLRAQKNAQRKENARLIVELRCNIAEAEEVFATITALLARKQVG
jgi:hypothetical protein